jgi:hypothetical protein
MFPKPKTILILLSIVLALLMIPLIAMLFTDNVTWSFMDFVMAGILLLGTSFIIELVLQKVKSKQHRFLICGIVLLVLFILWAELAVGIFGSPIAGS